MSELTPGRVSGTNQQHTNLYIGDKMLFTPFTMPRPAALVQRVTIENNPGRGIQIGWHKAYERMVGVAHVAPNTPSD